jgi:sugar phosphate isomerase/epimerase
MTATFDGEEDPMTRTRRQFLRDGALAAAGAVALTEGPALFTGPAPAVAWPIGCFNRPWTKWSYAEALKSIKAAGYGITGLLTRTKEDPFIAADATPEYLEGLKRAIAASGLTANMGALRSRHDIPIEDTVKGLRTEIDHAAFLGLKSVMTFGIDNPAQFDHYFKAMADAAAYGAEKGVQVVMKPHGGSSGASDEIIAAMKKVGHPNFRIWYDAGNIIYYTGKDPVEELKPIVQYVTGFCAKDCAEPKGDVMIQFGAGKVDFAGVFTVLKSAGFNGPIMVECCAVGETAEATAANARANREFLEKVLAQI